ncbi:MAG: hypothetical protein OEY01_10245 [Desulfobulbaceae bacterium]|nr:hypothetical protein [Desulfobulbaceae bacterium]
MGYELEYGDNGRELVVSCCDSFSGADWVTVVAGLYSDGEMIKKIRRQLFDLTRVSSLAMSNEEVRELVELEKETAEINRDRVIAVVAVGGMSYGMGRVWKSYMDVMVPGVMTMIFKDLESARLWLNGNSKVEGRSASSGPHGYPAKTSGFFRS